MTIAETILDWRIAADLEQKAVAQALGIQPKALSYLERGIHRPLFETVLKVAKYARDHPTKTESYVILSKIAELD